MTIRTGKRHMTVLRIAVVCSIYLIMLFDRPTVAWLTDEDGIVETFGAAMCLIAAGAFGFAYMRSAPPGDGLTVQNERGRNMFYLFLSLLLLVACLEEISWGQRILHIRTPPALAKINYQQEINIHNLTWFNGLDSTGERKPFLQLLYNGDRLFSVFWFTYCVCIPLLVRYSPKAGRLSGRIRLPIVPVEYAILFPLNYVASKGVTAMYPMCDHNIAEVKEMMFEVLFAWIALGQVCRLTGRPSEDL